MQTMESNANDFIEQDEIEWIERRKHDLILRKYRLHTQRLIKEYQMKILQQNRQIDGLVKEVKRQKFIIDTFSNADELVNEPKVTNGAMNTGKESESELEPIICAVNEQQNHTKNDTSSRNRPIVNGRNDFESRRQKPSLVSIHIQPHFQSSAQQLPNVYICDECNKTVSSRRVLAKHKRMVHCLQKEFVCDHCSKAFCVRDGLKRHLRIHTGEKPFVCRGCHKGFNQSGNMRIHEKTCKKYLRLNSQ